MEQFAVLRKIGGFTPSVVETFSNVADAAAFANILRRKNDGWKEYAVYQLNEAL